MPWESSPQPFLAHGYVVIGKKRFVRAGGDDLQFIIRQLMKEMGRSPAVEKSALVIDGGVLGGNECGRFVVTTGERGHDCLVQADRVFAEGAPILAEDGVWKIDVVFRVRIDRVQGLQFSGDGLKFDRLERWQVLIDGRSRYPPAVIAIDVIRAVHDEFGHLSVNVAAFHATTHDELVAAPGVIGTRGLCAAVGSTGSAKVGGSERGHIVLFADLDRGVVEGLQRFAEFTIQLSSKTAWRIVVRLSEV